MLKLLIIDGAEDFRAVLAQALKDTYIIRTCADGEEALEQIREFMPDLLILDLALTGLDGLSLIEVISETHTKPLVLATTRFQSDYVLEASPRIGVDYMMLKPCNIRAVRARLADMVNSRKPRQIARPDPRVTVANMLHSLGIPSGRKGYIYLREAVPLYAKDRGQAVTKELYPEIAKIYNAEAKRVERTIRAAIRKAWENRDDQIWRMYFSPQSDGEIPRPTNLHFIARLAEVLISKWESGDE